MPYNVMYELMYSSGIYNLIEGCEEDEDAYLPPLPEKSPQDQGESALQSIIPSQEEIAETIDLPPLTPSEIQAAAEDLGMENIAIPTEMMDVRVHKLHNNTVSLQLINVVGITIEDIQPLMPILYGYVRATLDAMAQTV